MEAIKPLNDLKEAIIYLAGTQWVYLAYILPLAIAMLIFYVKNQSSLFMGFRGFIKWLKPSFESGGTSSPEKLTAFMLCNFAYIPGRLIFAFQVTDPIHLLWGSVIDASFILILYRIISPAQILELKTGIKLPEPKD